MAWTKREKKLPLNAVTTIENGKIVIRIDPDVRIRPSKSGLTEIIAEAEFGEVPGLELCSFNLLVMTKDKSV